MHTRAVATSPVGLVLCWTTILGNVGTSKKSN